MQAFNYLWALPTWLMFNFIMCFVSTEHMTNAQYVGMSKWVVGRTLLSKTFDIVFWVYIVSLLVYFNLH